MGIYLGPLLFSFFSLFIFILPQVMTHSFISGPSHLLLTLASTRAHCGGKVARSVVASTPRRQRSGDFPRPVLIRPILACFSLYFLGAIATARQHQGHSQGTCPYYTRSHYLASTAFYLLACIVMKEMVITSLRSTSPCATLLLPARAAGSPTQR